MLSEWGSTCSSSLCRLGSSCFVSERRFVVSVCARQYVQHMCMYTPEVALAASHACWDSSLLAAAAVSYQLVARVIQASLGHSLSGSGRQTRLGHCFSRKSLWLEPGHQTARLALGPYCFCVSTQAS
jgi:hypothetical protein